MREERGVRLFLRQEFLDHATKLVAVPEPLISTQLVHPLLNNVWCVACRKTTTIVRFTGKMERGDIVLQGHRIRCDGPVARVVEGK